MHIWIGTIYPMVIVEYEEEIIVANYGYQMGIHIQIVIGMLNNTKPFGDYLYDWTVSSYLFTMQPWICLHLSIPPDLCTRVCNILQISP